MRTVPFNPIEKRKSPWLLFSFLAMCAAACFCSSAERAWAEAWPMEREWSEDEELAYSKWFEKLASKQWRSTNRMLHDPESNSLYDEEDKNLYFYADCADLPYVIRAYYAYKRRLPFIANEVSGGRYTKKGNRTSSTFDNLTFTGTVQQFFNKLDLVHSGNFRTGPDATDSFTHPIAIDRQNLHPGTVFYSPNGHVAMVAECQRDGTIKLLDAHPDQSVTRITFGPKLEVRSRTFSGGFRDFRPVEASSVEVAWATENSRIPSFSKEQFEKVTTLVVDKTGTLTEGKPKLMDVLPNDFFDPKEFLHLAASLEQNSEHPLAAAIVQGAKQQDLTLNEVKDFRSVTAGGVVGTVADRAVMVGKPDFLRNEKITGLEPLKASAMKLQEDGKTAMFVAIDGKPAGILAVADPIKSTTAEAIKELHALGLEIVMLTGDNRRTAAAVVKQLGLDAVEAEIDPAGKVAHVKKLRAEGKHVAMAGDGINDAPALSEAEVGIAMGTGTDVAMQSAGITLVKGDLRGIAKAIRLSRATMWNIRENLFFAFLYNALGIPVAAGALYPFFGLLLSPIIAGAAMSLSSVSVIGNALRLRKARL